MNEGSFFIFLQDKQLPDIWVKAALFFSFRVAILLSIEVHISSSETPIHEVITSIFVKQAFILKNKVIFN